MDTLIRVGEPAPDFELPDLEGNIYRLIDWRGQIVVINFWSAECPWAERADKELLSYLSGWEENVVLCSIASNANEPPELLSKVRSERDLPLLLYDENQRVADFYGAKTTPHLFVVDRGGILRYQGAINDITFRQRTATRYYLKDAVEALLADRLPDPVQMPPYGCTIVRHT